MNPILHDRELTDLVDRLDAATEALSDTLGALEPAKINGITRDIDAAIGALEAAASYLHRLRYAEATS